MRHMAIYAALVFWVAANTVACGGGTSESKEGPFDERGLEVEEVDEEGDPTNDELEDEEDNDEQETTREMNDPDREESEMEDE